jgi:putative heme-binding domain-containing protein
MHHCLRLECGRRLCFSTIFSVCTLVLVHLTSGRLLADPGAPPRLELRPGDHISIIGNTLADRMQHDGRLETFFYSRFPKHDLVFRNLGHAADELTVRLRSANFGTPDQWLTKTKTDVVFAFFGYNESFAGAASLPKFKQDLDAFLKGTLGKQYNGKSAPRLVLFSPIAHENLRSRDLPDGSENNRRLEQYTAAMAEVARANQVPFVDLFHASRDLYARSSSPLTINGVHLNQHGNQLIAEAIDKALFPMAPPVQRDTERMEKIRRAVLDKNFYWFNRYRTVDGYSIYGGRAGLRFVGGQTNKVVMDREMDVLDIMTANRDRRVWAVAQGRDLTVNDDNTPPFIPVETNKPGPLPGGKHLYLGPEAAIGKMTVAKHMKVNLFASEKDFPELANPVQMEFDAQGRLWVAVWPTYPHWRPKEEMNDKILVLEDTKGTGKADKMTVFADHLHCPTGFAFYNGAIIVAQAPDLVYLKDTDGDGKADVRVRILSGLDSADTHHTANSFEVDPGGAVYFQEGTFHHTQVETPYGPPVRNANAGVYRYEPRTQKFEVYVNFGFANPHGHVFDRWGQDIITDGTGAQPYHAALFSGQTADYKQRHARPPQVYRQKTRPCPGIEILSSRHFPESMQGDLLVGNVIGFQGILRYKIEDKGASFAGTEAEPILSSTDPNFRPSDLRIGPDGALYFLDWHNPLIGHMQHNLRDPSRDREHGRIYRVTYEGRPLLQPVQIDGAPLPRLLEVLKEPEDRVRYRARLELSARDTDQVVAAVGKWIGTLDKRDPAYEHHLLEALWVHQAHNAVNEGLLRRLLRSPDFHARAAATRVLCYWRDRVQDPLALLRVQINDQHPRVRLEVIRALSFFDSDNALAVAVELLAHPDDEYLRYTFNETLNTLERRLGSGTKVDRKNIAVSLLRMLDTGRVPPERQSILIETVCRRGGAKELKAVWDKVLDATSYSPELRRRVLDWLTEAAATRHVQPDFRAGDVRRLLEESARARALLPDAIRLATAWKAKEAADEFRTLARDGKMSLEARQAAIDGLVALGDAASLKAVRELTVAPAPIPVRFRAATALAQADLEAGAKAAAAALAAAGPTDDLSPVVEAFLIRKNGPDKLAAALAQEKVSADTAKHILRAMYLAGHNDVALGKVVSKFAGIDAVPRPPTEEEVRKLTAEALAQGDPTRGERVFRRADLGCVKCHALNKAGGHIGPDLGPVGAASPMDYIITSILDPSASIKEEYLTKVISTNQGQIITGIVVERNRNQVVLKDATGKLTRIARKDIDEEANGKSLMPDGITRILTHAELVDLIRFVSELGKPGPYAVPAVPTIQRWKRLREVPAALRDGNPNREVIRDTVLRAGPEAWDTVNALVNGKLPLDDLHKPGRPEVIYLQGEVEVVQGGAVEVRVEAMEPVTFWIDEDGFEKQNRAVAQLMPGRHLITVRVAVGNAQAPTLRVELRKPADSGAHFEVIHGD